MKKFRKFTAMVTAIALAGCMMTSMSMLNVSADTTEVKSGSITISNATANHVYEAYQIFNGTLVKDSVTGATTLTEITWGSGIDSNKITDLVNELQTISAFNSVPDYSSTDDTSASKVAEILSEIDTVDNVTTIAFANVVGKYLASAATATSGTQSNNTYTIDITDPGYYLVKDKDKSITGDDTYTKYIVQVLDDVTGITPKTGKPSFMKKVQENNMSAHDTTTISDTDDDKMSSVTINDNYNDVADYNIGDAVPFRLYAKLPNDTEYARYDTYYLEFSDTLDTQFDMPTTLIVKIGENILSAGIDYTYKIDNTTHKINVYFANTKKITSAIADAVITVDYTATLNSSAVIGNPGQENVAKLIYSNNPNNSGSGKWSNDSDTPSSPNDTPDIPSDTGETPDDNVVVFTYELDINKVDGKNKETKLKGAKFKLQATDGTNATKWAVVTDDKISNWVDNEKDATELSTNVDGLIKIQGIDAGTYSLKETVAPVGYNMLSAPITVTVISNTKNDQASYTRDESTKTSNALTALTISYNGTEGVAKEDSNWGIVEATIANNKGSSLPSTGGIGTTIFYTVGGVLVVGAGVTLIAKKRAKNEQ